MNCKKEFLKRNDVKTAKLKRPTKPSVGENVEQLELLVECKLVKSSWKTIWQYLLKLMDGVP